MKIHFKKLSKVQITVIAVILILIIVLVPSAIYCGVNSVTPKQMLTDMFTSNEEQLIGSWQGEKALTAYEFKDDGTYDSYIGSYSFTGNYVADSNTITLSNPDSNEKVMYSYSIHGDTLNMTLLKENGENPIEKEKYEYTKVEHINPQSIIDYLKDSQINSEEAE